MEMKEFRVIFQPSGRTVFVLPETSMLEAAGLAGIILQTPCGGQGTCGKCLVKVISGKVISKSKKDDTLKQEALEQGYCLACQTSIAGPVTIEIPEESTFESQQQILTTDSGKTSSLKPAVSKKYFQLQPPSSKDPQSDLARLSAVLEDIVISSDFTGVLPGFMRSNNWNGTAVIHGNELIALEAGDTSNALYGVAFDIGTTTVVGTMFDLQTAKELAVESKINAQIIYGDDVISRILKIREKSASLKQLQESIIGTVNNIIGELARKTNISVENIYETVIVGNSTMQQILCGYDPSALGEIPFIQAFDRAQTISAARLGIKVNTKARVYVFPQLGGFVGGDTTAGMLASSLGQQKKNILFIDIGTNGEIVLSCGKTLLAASTAAGPAFEGARIMQGMRATKGAIEKVIISDDVMLNIIGNTKPAGICGTALIDAAAELLRIGILDVTGRILSKDEASSDLPDKVLKRLMTDKDNNTCFVLAEAGETASGKAISLCQKDIRELQLAVGAIRAGTNILLRHAGIGSNDLDEVLLAGAFGNFIRRNNARRIGLLPQIPCSRISFIGNAASLGAKLALISTDERLYAEELRKKTKHVDLSSDMDFQMEFAESMIFPETELSA